MDKREVILSVKDLKVSFRNGRKNFEAVKVRQIYQ